MISRLIEQIFFHRTSFLFPIISSVLLSLSLPSVGLWFLSWIALVPFLLYLRAPSVTSKHIVLATLLMGLPYAAVAAFPVLRVEGSWWMVSQQGSSFFRELLLAAGIILGSWWGALFFLPFAWCASRRSIKFGLEILLLAFVWAFMEFVRARVGLFGYDWGTIGYTLLDTQYLKYTARLAGPYGLSFLLVGWNVFIVFFLEAVHSYKDKDKDKEKRSEAFVLALRHVLFDKPYGISPLVFILIWQGVLLYGMMQALTLTSPLQAPLRVAVIASDIRTEASIGKEAYKTYRGWMDEALLRHPDILLFPENAFPFFELDEATNGLYPYSFVLPPERYTLYEDFLLGSRQFPETVIAVGLHTVKNATRYNSLVLFQNGRVITIYHKRKLVPFSEYAPFGLTLPIVERMHEGSADGAFTLLGNKASALICSEVDDSLLVPYETAIILSPSNDSVFVSPWLTTMHVSMARMRALESGAYLFRSSKGGMSEIIAPDGSIVASRTLGGVLFTEVK